MDRLRFYALLLSLPLLAAGCCYQSPEGGSSETRPVPVVGTTDPAFDTESTALDRLEREVNADLVRLRHCPNSFRAEIKRKERTLIDISIARTLLKHNGFIPGSRYLEIRYGTKSVKLTIRDLARWGNYLVVFDSIIDIETYIEWVDLPALEQIKRLSNIYGWDLEIAGRVMVVRMPDNESRRQLEIPSLSYEEALARINNEFELDVDMHWWFAEVVERQVEGREVSIPSGVYTAREAVARISEKLGLPLAWGTGPSVFPSGNSLGDHDLEDLTQQFKTERDRHLGNARFIQVVAETLVEDGEFQRARIQMLDVNQRLVWLAEMDAELALLHTELERRSLPNPDE